MKYSTDIKINLPYSHTARAAISFFEVAALFIYQKTISEVIIESGNPLVRPIHNNKKIKE